MPQSQKMYMLNYLNLELGMPFPLLLFSTKFTGLLHGFHFDVKSGVHERKNL